ncbi:MAG TPA: WYL domain-containing protein [Actinomycetota bacterium]|nr:WYL domain-containing protein [Actinomycetota bacterium]
MTPERSKAARASERLGRMLVIVPYFVQHPGTEIAEAARVFDVPEQELRDDLVLLFMAGLPPYGPGDLIEVEIDEDRVHISMADQFSRPLRLTRSEALALYLRGTELLATPGLPDAPALRSALGKLATGLGPETLGEAARIQTAESGRPAELLDLLRDAARERARLEIEYFAASTGERTVRSVDPEEVFASLGNWYVAAWDVTNDAERLFRADRIRSARRTGDSFEPRGLAGAGRALYTPTDEDVSVRLLLRPGARWVAEYYATADEVERPDGSLEVTLPSRRLGWVAGLLLRLGTEAEVLTPPELSERVNGLAAQALRRYQEP